MGRRSNGEGGALGRLSNEEGEWVGRLSMAEGETLGRLSSVVEDVVGCRSYEQAGPGSPRPLRTFSRDFWDGIREDLTPRGTGAVLVLPRGGIFSRLTTGTERLRKKGVGEGRVGQKKKMNHPTAQRQYLLPTMACPGTLWVDSWHGVSCWRHCAGDLEMLCRAWLVHWGSRQGLGLGDL